MTGTGGRWALDPLSLSGGGVSLGLLPSPSSLVHGLLSGFFSAFDAWVLSGTAALLGELGKVLTTSPSPRLGSSFSAEIGALARIGELLALPFLVLAAIQAIVRQDLGLLLRAAFLRLPAALLLTGMATELVSLALGATDQACALLIQSGPSPSTLVANLVTLLGGSGPEGEIMSGFAGVVIALVAAAITFLLWLELAVRSAAVSVATLFLPLALAGMVWSATSQWARRLAETLTALVLAKLVIVAVLVLAAGTLSVGTGSAGLVEGVALLLLAAGAPFTLLRLIPMVEAGAIGHLDGLGRRGGRVVVTAGGLARDGFEWAIGGDEDQSGIDPVPRAEHGMGLDDPAVIAEAERMEHERADAPNGSGSSDA